VIRFGTCARIYSPEECRSHAFQHGLATELVEASVPVTVLQNQLRHADVKTALKVYAHVIPQSQRDAMDHDLRGRPRRTGL
jgi:integrase